MKVFFSNESVKKGTPLKTLFYRYWLVYGVKTVADRHKHVV